MNRGLRVGSGPSLGGLGAFGLPMGAGGGPPPWYLTTGVVASDVVCAFQPLGAGSLTASLTPLVGSAGTVGGVVIYSPYYGWVGGGQYSLGEIFTATIGLQNTALIRFSNSSGTIDLFGQKETADIIAIGTYQGKDFICGTTDNTVSGALAAGVVGLVTEANGNNALGYVNGSLVKTFASGYTETPSRVCTVFGTNTAGGASHVGTNDVQAFAIYNKKLTTDQILAISNNMAALPAAGTATQINGSVMLTFDDGLDNLYTTVFPYMSSKGLVGTAYVYTDGVGTAGHCSWAQLQEMAAAGWAIANHTKAGNNLAGQSEAAQEAELTNAKNALIANSLSGSANYVAYPTGGFDANTLIAMANTGMLNGRLYDPNVQFTFDIYRIDKYQTPSAKLRPADNLATATGLVDSAVANHKVAAFVLHDILDTPGSYGWSTANFQGLADYIAAQNVPCLTVNQFHALRSLW